MSRIIGAILLLGGLLAAVAWLMHQQCAQRMELELRRAAEARQAREQELLNAIRTEQSRRKVQYVERVKIVEATLDPSGCADQPVPDDIDRRLRAAP